MEQSNKITSPAERKFFLSILSDVKNDAAARRLGKTRHSQPDAQSRHTNQASNT